MLYSLKEEASGQKRTGSIQKREKRRRAFHVY